VLRGGIHTTSLLCEWVRSDLPFPAVDAGEACPTRVTLDRETAPALGNAHDDQAARRRRLVHCRLHAEVMLLLECSKSMGLSTIVN
jgi:hypothetical protein